MQALTSETLVTQVESAGPRVVRFDRPRRRSATGVRMADDLAIASHRTLDSDDEIRGVLSDGTEVPAQVVGRDPGIDLVVLRLGEGTPAIDAFAPRDVGDLRVGELALTVAKPGRSVRAALGMLSVVGEAVRAPSGTSLDRWLELDRDLPRGFSGGLVVDLEGRALGVATRGLADGAAVIVPGATLLRVVDQIVQHGRVPQGYLGVGVYPARLPPGLHQPLGQHSAVAVVGLADNGPAASAGVLVGDLILKIAGQPIRNPMQLRAELIERSGEPIDVTILRGGHTQDLRITAGTRP